jgi:hypothetical protein
MLLGVPLMGMPRHSMPAHQAGEVEELFIAAEAWLCCCKVVWRQALAVWLPAARKHPTC